MASFGGGFWSLQCFPKDLCSFLLLIGSSLVERVCSTSVLPTSKRLFQEHEGGCNENARDEKEGS